jgi:hypothetical protein
MCRVLLTVKGMYTVWKSFSGFPACIRCESMPDNGWVSPSIVLLVLVAVLKLLQKWPLVPQLTRRKTAQEGGTYVYPKPQQHKYYTVQELDGSNTCMCLEFCEWFEQVRQQQNWLEADVISVVSMVSSHWYCQHTQCWVLVRQESSHNCWSAPSDWTQNQMWYHIHDMLLWGLCFWITG